MQKNDKNSDIFVMCKIVYAGESNLPVKKTLRITFFNIHIEDNHLKKKFTHFFDILTPTGQVMAQKL